MPVGVAPVVGPATVAVKVKVEPSDTVVALVVTTTLGINLIIEREVAALGPAVV